ncbi:hypothetical protein SMD22_01410 (plasmid) [Brevibacillus halotolerans]|nr:hypothetical protein SMD22_01410 [Brevibacillus halotolerans]
MGLEVLGSVVFYHNPQATILVYEQGIVAHYQLFKWENIEQVKIIKKEMLGKIHLKSGEVVKIQLVTLIETPEQFSEAIKFFAPQDM